MQEQVGTLKEKHKQEVSALKKKHRDELSEGKQKQGEAVKVHQQQAKKQLGEQCQATAAAQKALADATNSFTTASKVPHECWHAAQASMSNMLAHMFSARTMQPSHAVMLCFCRQLKQRLLLSETAFFAYARLHVLTRRQDAVRGSCLAACQGMHSAT